MEILFEINGKSCIESFRSLTVDDALRSVSFQRRCLSAFPSLRFRELGQRTDFRHSIRHFGQLHLHGGHEHAIRLPVVRSPADDDLFRGSSERFHDGPSIRRRVFSHNSFYVYAVAHVYVQVNLSTSRRKRRAVRTNGLRVTDTIRV